MRTPAVQGEPRWGIMSTFPLLMPVIYNAQVFPRFFATNKELGLAFLPKDEQIEKLQENRTLSLKGSLCFLVMDNSSAGEPCIAIGNLSSAWLRQATWGPNANIVANATVNYGW